jgi:hypothetical protein
LILIRPFDTCDERRLRERDLPAGKRHHLRIAPKFLTAKAILAVDL